MTAKHSYCDILIVGAGPAGLMAATWATAQGLGATTRIIDKRNDKIFTGQADGLQCRTLEVFQSFGLAEDVWRQSNHMLEICLWNPDENGRLHRSSRIPDTIPGISRWQQVVLHQGRIERLFLDKIKKNSGDQCRVERGVLPEQLDIDESKIDDPTAYPCTVTLRQLSDEEATPPQLGKSAPNGLFRSALAPDDTPTLLQNRAGQREVLHAKYVIGCDGAHSWTRRSIGSKMEGESTDFVWGVIDAVPITNFPDVRNRCAIHSQDSGSVMIIPREDGLVRFYIQISHSIQNVDRNTITWEAILGAAQKTFAPYTLDIHPNDVSWWTAYVIGQRTADEFAKFDRVFIAGDACHTHSPKAGQGMNVSMMDTYNLTWKICSVVKGHSPRSILKTYQSERRKVAIDLITFDHKFSRLFSGKPAKDAADEAGISLDEFKHVFETGNRFASGTSVNYGPSLIVGKRNEENQDDGTAVEGPGALSKPELSSPRAGETRIEVGKRLNSAQVVCQSDARPWQLVDWMPSDGRWRILVFCGDIRNGAQLSKVKKLSEYLEHVLVPQYTPEGDDVDSVIEVLTVSKSPRLEVELTDYPRALRPLTTRWHQPGTGGSGQSKVKSQDYWKVFTDDETYHEGHGHAYEKYGIDSRGASVVVRPDGYVALLISLEDHAALGEFFSRCLLPASQHLWTRSRGAAEAVEETTIKHDERQLNNPLTNVGREAAVGIGAI